ncbi:MAG: NAD-glutamate dehydrogenase [Candidatus Rhabdochlamydia sp.]
MTIERKEFLTHALSQEATSFETMYAWMQMHLPASLFQEMDEQTLRIMTHNLAVFDVQGFFSLMTFNHQTVVLSLDQEDADMQILARFKMSTIQDYKTFLSDIPPPFADVTVGLRITLIHFIQEELQLEPLSLMLDPLLVKVQKKTPLMTKEELNTVLQLMGSRFIRSLSEEALLLAVDVFIRSQEKDPCQLEVRTPLPNALHMKHSLSITLAWKNVPQQDFLFQIAKVIHHHGFSLKNLSATHMTPYEKDNTLVMSLTLQALKEEDFERTLSHLLQDLVMVKYFPHQELLDRVFVESKRLSQTSGHVLKAVCDFIHQLLVHVDPHLYTFSLIEEAFCRHMDITVKLMQAFEEKFHPEKANLNQALETLKECIRLIDHIDTGQEMNDKRRKVILSQGINFIFHLLKTNVYRRNKTAFSFRMDPLYLENAPINLKEKFPELPFAVFFMKGLHFTGFHIRFRDLARGGLRTVCPQQKEAYLTDRNTLFTECYNLALTQQKKNKDIPEGGAKGVILLEPSSDLEERCLRYRAFLKEQGVSSEDIETKATLFYEQQKQEHLYESQRAYTESFITLLNCDDTGILRAKHLIDYYQKPEYIYLGPDENMHNTMITWIANYAKKYHYKPGICFMSSKPGAGINHKQYGVTSSGIHVYMEEVLKFMGINPSQDIFTVKMTGGPDGDVAGNQMHNLFKYYPHTARLLATLDISGAIFDPEGLHLNAVNTLFEEEKPVSYYPPELLHEGGFLLKVASGSPLRQEAMMIKKERGKVTYSPLSSDACHHLLRTHIHQVKADIFIPGGGRPKTLHANNYQDFLDQEGRPTSKAIIEGGNLYLSQEARSLLEEKGVLIVKDSSANKGGVICSSFEVLGGLVLSEEAFINAKNILAKEILSVIQSRSYDEIQALLRAFKQEKTRSLTQLSENISEKINHYTDELFSYLEPLTLSQEKQDLFTRSLMNYALPFLRNNYEKELLTRVPILHQKSIIAAFIAQRLVYRKGVTWAPSVLDVLPLILQDENILSH